MLRSIIPSKRPTANSQKARGLISQSLINPITQQRIANSLIFKTLRLSLALGLIASLSACIDEFQYDGFPEEDILVIEGKYTTTPGSHFLKLYFASPLGSGRTRKVTSATVNLVDEDGNESRYFNLGEGNYRLDDSQGIPGKTYTLEIAFAGKEYQSMPEKMPEVIKADSLSWDWEVRPLETSPGQFTDRRFIDLFVNSPLPGAGEDFWLRWTSDEAFSFPDLVCHPLDIPGVCYVTDLPLNTQDIFLYNGPLSNTDVLVENPVGTKLLDPDSPAWRGRHYFNVYQHSITRRAHEFWDQANKVANQTGSIFDAPPATVRSNVFNVDNEEELVLGIFELAAMDTVRTFVTPADISGFFFPFPYCPLQAPIIPPDTPSECCNCVSLEGASLDRPYYW